MGFLRNLNRPRPLSERYLERGLDYLDNKKYDEAIADLTGAINEEPHNAELYTTRGFIYLEANDSELVPYARADFEYALYLDDQQMVAEYCLGMMAYADEEYEEALRRFGKTREIAPLRAEIYYYRALCYHQLGDSQRAYDEMDIAKPLFDPGDPRHKDAVRWGNTFKKKTKKPRVKRRKKAPIPEVDPRELPASEQPLLVESSESPDLMP